MSGRVGSSAAIFPLAAATLALVGACSQPKPRPQLQAARPAASPVITAQQPIALTQGSSIRLVSVAPAQPSVQKARLSAKK
jgi:hypothetical protein